MREYEKIKIETKEKRKTTKQLTKLLCDTCKKEIQKSGSGKRAYIPAAVITASRIYSYQYWSRDIFDFCSLECFLEWAKGEVDVFEVYFPRDALNNLASEYARLKSRDSRLTALENSNTEIKEEK